LYQGAWSTAISHGVLLLSTLAKSACKHKIVEKMGKEFFKKKWVGIWKGGCLPQQEDTQTNGKENQIRSTTQIQAASRLG
jgi:hypothetical protein